MLPRNDIFSHIFVSAWRREIIFTFWLVQHLQLKLFSSLRHSGLAPTFHLTLFCYAFHVQSGIINFQPKRSILRWRGNKMRKIVSEFSTKKFTAFPLYENKLKTASDKYGVHFNVNVKTLILEPTTVLLYEVYREFTWSYKSEKESTKISGLYFLWNNSIVLC